MIDDAYLKSAWPMWELSVMMQAHRESCATAATERQPTQRRNVLPVFLLDVGLVETKYLTYWGDSRRREVSDPPVATLDDIRQLCSRVGIRQDQVNTVDPPVTDV